MTDIELLDQLETITRTAVTVSFERLWLNGAGRWQVGFSAQFSNNNTGITRYVSGGGNTFREALANAFEDRDVERTNAAIKKLLA